jgi:hypothetical protein
MWGRASHEHHAPLMSMFVALLAGGSHAYETSQGHVNVSLVMPELEMVVNLANVRDKELRYFDLVEPASRVNATRGTRLLFAGRGGRGAFWPHDETWNVQLLHEDAYVPAA